MVHNVVGPMARPGARRHGPGLGLNYDSCVAGRAWTYFSLADSGPGLIIQFAGRARSGSAQLLRAGPGLGLKSYLRAGPGPKCQARAGP